MSTSNDVVAKKSSSILDEVRVTLGGQFQFEAKSFLGRLLRMDIVPTGDASPRLLHLGSGNNILDGFANADFFMFKGPRSAKPEWMLDLRYPLRCPDNYWDGAFTEHTFEHLYPTQVDRLFKELLRVLKPGARLRVCVPNIRKYVDYYAGLPAHENFQKYFGAGIVALRNATQNYFHSSVWDGPCLSAAFTRAGFVNVSEENYGIGADPRIVKDTPDREWESLYVEGQKPVS